MRSRSKNVEQKRSGVQNGRFGVHHAVQNEVDQGLSADLALSFVILFGMHELPVPLLQILF